MLESLTVAKFKFDQWSEPPDHGGHVGMRQCREVRNCRKTTIDRICRFTTTFYRTYNQVFVEFPVKKSDPDFLRDTKSVRRSVSSQQHNNLRSLSKLHNGTRRKAAVEHGWMQRAAWSWQRRRGGVGGLLLVVHYYGGNFLQLLLYLLYTVIYHIRILVQNLVKLL